MAAVILAAAVAAVGLIYWNAAHKAVSYKIVPASKVVKKKGAAVLPRVVKKFENPEVAIVIDDFGYTLGNINVFLGIKKPLTLSILPDLRYSRTVAGMGSAAGLDVILHMPMESHNKNATEESDTIKPGMDEGEVLTRLEKAIASVPGLDGVSNHQGSMATEDKPLMSIILKRLKEKHLYFFDSVTSRKSICKEVAASLGERCAKRDIFLDNESSPEYITKQVLLLKRYAFRNGRAIAIGHDRKNTAKVLSEMMPELEREGVRFVLLSKMVK